MSIEWFLDYDVSMPSTSFKAYGFSAAPSEKIAPPGTHTQQVGPVHNSVASYKGVANTEQELFKVVHDFVKAPVHLVRKIDAIRGDVSYCLHERGRKPPSVERSGYLYEIVWPY